MKKMISLNKAFVLLLTVTLVGVSCVKKDDYYKKNDNETARKQTVQLTGASDIISFARDAKTTKDTFILIDVRRYPNSADELNQPLTVKLVKNSGLISSYNTANGTGYLELPANSYTLLGDLNAVTFQPGEAVKEIKISVDQTKLDLSQQYALGFSIADAGTNAVIVNGLKNGLYAIGVKNKYDGIYKLTITTTGWGAYGIADGVTGLWPNDVAVITSGASSVIMDQGFSTLQPALTSAGDATQFGATSPEFVFDPATDKLIDVHNTIPDDGRGRVLLLNTALNSYYDPSTKTIYAHYIMKQNGRPNQLIDEVLTYKGVR